MGRGLEYCRGRERVLVSGRESRSHENALGFSVCLRGRPLEGCQIVRRERREGRARATFGSFFQYVAVQ